MKAGFAIFAGFIGFIILILGINFLGNAFDFWQYSFFAPKIVAVQTKVFQESQAYNEGMVRDLEEIQRQYVSADTPNAKEALRQIAIHRFEAYPNEKLPSDLQQFYNQLKGGLQ